MKKAKTALARQRLLGLLTEINAEIAILASAIDRNEAFDRMMAGPCDYLAAATGQLLHEEVPLGGKWPQHFQSLVLEMKALAIILGVFRDESVKKSPPLILGPTASEAYDLASRFVVQFSRVETFGRTFRCWNANYWAIYQRRQIAQITAMVRSLQRNDETGARDALLAVCAMSHQICMSRPSGTVEVAPYLESISRLLRALP